MAKYPYIVNCNGVWYSAGTEIPAEKTLKEENTENKMHTKTEINRMPTAELKELAKKQGILNAEEKNGSELKTLLIEQLGL